MIKIKLEIMGLLAITAFVLPACGETFHTALDPEEGQMLLPPTPEDDAPLPAWSTAPADELARYNEYLTQAGINDPSAIWSEKEVQACDVLVHQGAVTFDSGVTKKCTWQQSEPGWVIESVRVEVKENKNGRGSYTESIIAADGQFNVSVDEIGDRWSAAIDLAANAKDFEVQKQLEIGYQHHMDRVAGLSSVKNSVYLEVNANGGILESSTIHVVAIAKLIRVL